MRPAASFLVVVLCATFFTLPRPAAAQAPAESQAEIERLRAENEKLWAQCDELKALCERFRAEVAAAQEMMAKMKAALDEQLKERAVDRDRMAAKEQTALAALKQAQELIEALQKERATLRSMIVKGRAGRTTQADDPFATPPAEDPFATPPPEEPAPSPPSVEPSHAPAEEPLRAQGTAGSGAELERLRAENAELKAQCDKLEKAFEQYRAEAAAPQKTTANANAVMNAILAMRVAERDVIALKLKSAQAELDATREQVAALQKELAMLREGGARPGREPAGAGARDPFAPPTAPERRLPRPEAPQKPPVEGLITAIAGGGLVEISIGTDDGIQKGRFLDVYRLSGDQGIYIGRLQVVKTSPDVSVCKSIPEFERRTLQKGDRVTTRFQ